MEIEYTGRQTTITKKLKLSTEAGLKRIAKVAEKVVNVHVILTTEKYRHCAEIALKTRNSKLVAKCEATEMDVALGDALNKIEQQAIRQKQKFTTIKRHSKAGAKGPKGEVVKAVEAPEPVKVSSGKASTKNSVGRKAVPMLVHSFPSKSPLQEPHVVRSADSVARRPMSLEEAVKEAAFRDRDVFVFRNHAGQAMVLHRKRDGKMELIEVP
jgi:putative sigma-54 modulation protein